MAYARKVEGDMYESANTRVRNLNMVSKGLKMLEIRTLLLSVICTEISSLFVLYSVQGEYYHLLAEKIYKIQKELEEKRRTRLQKQGMMPGQPGIPSPGPPQGPPSMGQPPMGPVQPPSKQFLPLLHTDEIVWDLFKFSKYIKLPV